MFGPLPRKYIKRMPKKMRRAALCSALSSKAQAGQIVVVDGLAMQQPKTKQAVELLNALEFANERVLVVLAERDMALERSFSNLPTAKTLVGGYLNVRDVLGYDRVLFSKEAIEPVEIWLGGETGPAASDDEGESEAEE